MDSGRKIKDLLYEQVARIGKAMSSPKRLELIELLCQNEKTVDMLARDASISMKLASAHLRELRKTLLVETRREGKNIYYRLSNQKVADFWVFTHTFAEAMLTDLQSALRDITSAPAELVPSDRDTLLKAARNGDIVVLDVRPADEYLSRHLPFARSIPLGELQQRIGELPKNRPIVAYCRGPFCLMAKDAVDLLNRQGYQGIHLKEGVAEWSIPYSTR